MNAEQPADPVGLALGALENWLDATREASRVYRMLQAAKQDIPAGDLDRYLAGVREVEARGRARSGW